jgi:hypothetical protein
MALPITYDFEGFSDSDAFTSLLGPFGLTATVTNATVITAGVSLNDFDFPPVSGRNVIYDSGGAMTIAFSTGVQSIAGLFTYNGPVTMLAYSGSVQVGSVASALSENYLSSGNTPQELLQISGIGLFDTVVISGSQFGGSFVVDDLTIDVPEAVGVPEPGTLSLLALGVSLGWYRRRKQSGLRVASN